MNQECLTDVQNRIKLACKKGGREPDEVTLVVISKGQPVEQILSLYDKGLRVFGENRIPEVHEKQSALPQDISWHFIGSLQTNKVRRAVGSFSLIQSVDSFHLAQKIDQVSNDVGVVTKLLLQVNTSKEPSKHGMSAAELYVQFPQFLALKNIQISGLMTMAARISDEEKERERARFSFRELRELRDSLHSCYPECVATFVELSMGMSQDFEIAIEEGATLVRIGSLLFPKEM